MAMAGGITGEEGRGWRKCGWRRGDWFRVGMVVFSRELDESSALRWMTGTKGRVSLWSGREEWSRRFAVDLEVSCCGNAVRRMRYQYIGI